MGLITDRVIPQLVIEKMIDIFGEEGIYNNEHSPKVFEHQIKVAKWMVDLDNNRPKEVDIVSSEETST